MKMKKFRAAKKIAKGSSPNEIKTKSKKRK